MLASIGSISFPQLRMLRLILLTRWFRIKCPKNVGKMTNPATASHEIEVYPSTKWAPENNDANKKKNAQVINW